MVNSKLKGESFKLIINPNEFSKGDVLTMDKNASNQIQITKVYKYNWWRRLLVWLGYPRVKMFTGVKVKMHEKNTIQ